MRQLSILPCALSTALSLLAVDAIAMETPQGPPLEGPWYPGVSLQGVVGDYSGSSLRERFHGEGIFFSSDYYERYGFTLGYNHAEVTFVAPTQDISQDAFFASLRANLTPDHWGGRLGLRMDGHLINNDDTTRSSDDVKVVAPVVSFSPFDQTWSLEVAGAYSDYYSDLSARQFSPAVGMAFNDKSDWVSLRPTLIDIVNPVAGQVMDDTVALDIKWSHWFDPDNFLRLNSLKANGMVGEKILNVDLDGASVYNLADTQKGSASMGLEWRVGTHASILLLGGYEAYENKAISDKYDSRSLYLSYSYNW